ncbi:MAG: NAD-dependent epimerase/dehydratase family protein [bacterium]
MSPTLLVTGANSFLAGNIIMELLNRGYNVRGMLRKTARLMISHERLQSFYGAITKENDVIKAAKDCNIIIHVASLTDQSIADYTKYEMVNVEGTRNIIKAAKKFNVKKIIYVSTANTFAYGTRTEPGNETVPAKYPFTHSGYVISKRKAQTIILDSFKESETEIIVVNPTFMIGPNDWKISSNRIILRALDSRFLLIPPGGKNFIHVKDVATGICNAVETGKDGECYILANVNLTYKEFYKKMFFETSKKPFLVTIPKSFLIIAGIAGNLVRYAGFNTAVNLTNMKILSIGNYYTANKAVREISLPQTPIEKAIEDTVSWFAKEKTDKSY